MPRDRSDKLVNITVYFTEEQVDRLDALHEATRIPKAVFVREGIDEVLRRTRSLWEDQAELSLPGLDTPPAARIVVPLLAYPRSPSRAQEHRGSPARLRELEARKRQLDEELSALRADVVHPSNEGCEGEGGGPGEDP